MLGRSAQTTALVLNALGTATQQRGHRDGLIIHSDRGTQFTSWAFSDRVRTAGIAPSMGAVGTAADNAMMGSFRGRMQVELLNRRRWKTRIELANAIHDYLVFHNTRRRHAALGMRTPPKSKPRGLLATMALLPERGSLRPLQRRWLTKALPLVSPLCGQNQSTTPININYSTTSKPREPQKRDSTKTGADPEPPRNPGRYMRPS